MFKIGDIVICEDVTPFLRPERYGIVVGASFRVRDRVSNMLYLADMAGNVVPGGWFASCFKQIIVDSGKATVRYSKKMEMHFYG
jgi:hypothetical protein